MEVIAEATGTGVVYHIEAPEQIIGAFIDAIAHSVLFSLE